ncbi:MAG: S16 family serine protease [Thermodesulfobacteriota bacterium]
MSLFKKPSKTGETAQQGAGDLLELRTRAKKAELPEPVSTVVGAQLDRLESMDSSSPEYGIGMDYVAFVLALPWNHFTEDNLDLKRAETILEKQHFGLRHVKERILDFLAVRALSSLQAFRILVVDDEPIARANLEHILLKEGYLVSTASNGLEALGLMERQEFELVLTDLKMEKMDGLQLLAAARKTAPHTEFIMITGYATVNSAVDALRKGASNYLAKPVDLNELRAMVRQLHNRKKHLRLTRSPILLFSGPPGTGKTSLGRAIAEALQRKFVCISLAGLRDEAELHGHRRTYVGAMPGRLINEIKRLGVKNPVFMLDEIDKIGQDFRGDPAAVLLEILDPEQNSRFTDHYVDLPFDLSGVMFIATANMVDKLPGPLRDRMENIPFSGYTEKEKQEIAAHYLIPRQLREHSLISRNVGFSPESILRVIRNYTLEAGLRNLEREIAAICRKLARLCLQNQDETSSKPLLVDESLTEQLLGPPKYTHQAAAAGHRIGVATGLVWTEFGGEIIFVEAACMRGSKQLILTGSLGDVLRESAQTAMSYIRSNAPGLGIDPDFFDNSDIHIHIPAGAVSKDGPSAGVTILVALISLITRKPARRDVALTGEITLSGRILSVSGIREKLLAAQRAGIRTVILPKGNELDIGNLDPDLISGMKIITAGEVNSLPELVLLDTETAD